jgi:hypothetical protein
LAPGGRKMEGSSEDTGDRWELEVIRGDSGGKQRDTWRHRKIKERLGAIHGRSGENTERFEEDIRRFWGETGR